MSDYVAKCRCGEIFAAIPATAKFHKTDDPDDCPGYYWECGKCKSTIYIPLPKGKTI